MLDTDTSLTPALLRRERQEMLAAWNDFLNRELRTPQIDRRTVLDFCSALYDGLVEALEDGLGKLPKDLQDLLSSVSTEFAERGLTPSQTATFVLSLKYVLGERHGDAATVSTGFNKLIDDMGLYSMDAFIRRREQIIQRQSQELMELSVPVVPLWEGILSLPIIGTLDSMRAQAITEKLLFEVARTGSRYAILDISGVPTVDTQTAHHLAKTVAAARLMGAECIITGIRPAIAQVVVALGIDLSGIQTRFSLAEGLRYCFAQRNLVVLPRA